MSIIYRQHGLARIVEGPSVALVYVRVSTVASVLVQRDR